VSRGEGVGATNREHTCRMRATGEDSGGGGGMDVGERRESDAGH
jgi:hypothetical protein